MPLPKGVCAPKSVRSIQSKYGRARILVCCPRGKWSGKRCRVGMRAIEVKTLDGVCKPFTKKALVKGTRIEHKEHPEFARSTARKIARDHLCVNPAYYRKERGFGGYLHNRAAEVLGWSVKDTQSVSLAALRDLVRGVDPALAAEISESIQSGAHIRGTVAADMSWRGPPPPRRR